jgi:amino acid adenylation domain-containing protein
MNASGAILSTPELSAAKKLLLEKRLQGSGLRSPAQSGLQRMSRPEHLPLSLSQQRLWFLDQLAPGNPVYNIFQVLRIKGPLKTSALEQSLATIVKRHETLRTTFGLVEGMPVQIIHANPVFRLGEIDLCSLPPQKQEESALRLAREEAARPFDLTKDLMVRATLLHLEGEDHVLVVTMHHIASDGWSLGVLFRELQHLYNARVQGLESSLSELPVQYADYALWQRQSLTGPVIDKQLAYWKDQLSGAPEILELPADRPRPAVQTFRGAAQIVTLPIALARALTNLSRQEGVTLYMMLLAAFSTLLHRYTRQSDIVVGSPIAGRTQTATEELIGFFINTLAIRADLSGDPTFQELLQRVRKLTLEAYANQDIPFDKLVVELQPERSTSHTPLFQVMFALQSAPSQPLELFGLTVLPMDLDNGTAKFDLTLAISETEQGLIADLEYNEDLFDRQTISRMLDHYRTLLESIVAHPEQRVSELIIMTPAERHELLVEYNQTQVDYPRDTPVHVLFEHQARSTPEAIAVQYERQLLTYRELNARANQLARHLVALGARPETCVGVYLDRTPELFIALLAILKAGAAYLPLDRTYPRQRIALMLEDAKVPLLISEERFAPELPITETRMVYLDLATSELARQSGANLDIEVNGESLAYVLYTSGSTGKPKGACIPHRAINRLVINSDYVPFGPDEVVAQASNVSFDAATFEIWGAFLNGGRLVIMTKDVVLSPKEFAEQLKKQRITTLFLTTSLFNLMAREVPGAFSTLKNVVFGGEAADARSVGEVLQNSPPRRLINGYGPTETTTFAAWYCPVSVPKDARSIPIGRPLANTRLYILDQRLQPVPMGVPGELYIGGDGVGKGYLNRAELTADRFIHDPFSERAGARLYKTGDLTRYLPDGNIEFLGRADLQVKIRGFRIEVGEIEACLGQHPSVRECAVTVREDVPGDKRLVAYCVPQLDVSLSTEVLREYLKEHLPEYMVPSAFVHLLSLPINANGKVNRRALPAPDPVPTDSTGVKTPARDKIEGQLVSIWESILNARPIGIRDRFFHLGGHSLLAVKLISDIEKVFGQKLSVSTVFRAPTIEQLATILRGGQLSDPASAIVDIQPRGNKPPLFLVHGAGGGMFWGYQNLSRHIGNEQPVYVIRSRGIDGDGQEEFRHIEEMAAQYIADLRTVQPKGPYYLGGYCFGGNVAYEMSRQLVAQGEHVAFLGLMNCAPPNSSYTRFGWHPAVLLKFIVNVGLWLGNIWDWTSKQRADFVRWKLSTARRRLNGLFRGKASDDDINEIVDLSSHTEEQRKLWTAHVQALIDYHPKPFPGRVTLYRSKVHQFLCSFDSACGWGDFASGGVSVHVVPGPHEGILEEPHVRELARQVKAGLEAAQNEHGSGPEPPTRRKIERVLVERNNGSVVGWHAA